MSSGATIWLTGLSGAGKTTSAYAVRDALAQRGVAAIVIDGDELRRSLSSDLGFSSADRDENVRRAGSLALLLAQQGVTVVVSLISPRAAARSLVRSAHQNEKLKFLEVHVATPLEICEQRDPKSLYRRARAGETLHLTGVDDPYEVPGEPDVVVSAELSTPREIAAQILEALDKE